MFADTEQPDCCIEDTLWHAPAAEPYRHYKRLVLVALAQQINHFFGFLVLG